MNKFRAATSPSNIYNLPSFTRSLILMLVFCFAGCAAGSCLSYGHSCWGAHGKRSESQNRLRASFQNNDRLNLARLLNGRLKVPQNDKNRVSSLEEINGNLIPLNQKDEDYAGVDDFVRLLGEKTEENTWGIGTDEDYDLLNEERYGKNGDKLESAMTNPRRNEPSLDRYAKISKLLSALMCKKDCDLRANKKNM